MKRWTQEEPNILYTIHRWGIAHPALHPDFLFPSQKSSYLDIHKKQENKTKQKQYTPPATQECLHKNMHKCPGYLMSSF